MKKYIFVFMTAICILLAAGCTGNSSDYKEGTSNISSDASNDGYSNGSAEAEAAKTEAPVLEIINSSLGKQEYGSYYVSGTAKSSRDLSYAEVKVKFYGPDGALVETGLDNINDLAAGEPWNFKVLCITTSDQRITEYKIAAGNNF